MRCRGGQFSFIVHAVPSHMFAGFSFGVVALQKCARASVSARTMRSQMTPLSFGTRSLCDMLSSARTVPPQMRAGFVGVVHAWVDFNFIAHRPLQLRRVSVSVRNQLPVRQVSGSVSSDGPVMNGSRDQLQFLCASPGADMNRCVDPVANEARSGFGAQYRHRFNACIWANKWLVSGFAGLRHEADP